jgi:hypothetical protein
MATQNLLLLYNIQPLPGTGFLPVDGMEYIAEVIKNTIFILVAMRILLVVGVIYLLFRIGYALYHTPWFMEYIKRFRFNHKGKSLSK